jgi:protein-tyrosine phosphatase
LENRLIDLHSHILPGLDDGSPDMATSMDMARMAAADGIMVMACTPHIMPGLYDNTPSDIRKRVQAFQLKLHEASIDLQVVAGCDGHMRPDFIQGLKTDKILTINGSRYVLFEPPHTVLPPRLEDLLFSIMASGFMPILTHPERLKWIETNFALIERLSTAGVWMQITAGSLTGQFGNRPQYWAEKMLGLGVVHVLATDAHNLTSRPPILSKAHDMAQAAIGREDALHLVMTRPVNILDNEPLEKSPPVYAAAGVAGEPVSGWRRWLKVG